MLDNTPSQPDIFEKHLSPQAAKIYRNLVTATRTYEQLALGVLAEISALGLMTQFESALERAPALLINAPAKDSSVLPSYWNFTHDVALRVFHPTANILNDSQINPLIGLAAVNLKFYPNDLGSRTFMSRFIASFIEKITARHLGEYELSADQRTNIDKVPEEIARQAVLNLGDLQAFANSIVTTKADTALFNRLDAPALAALSRGLISECTTWQFLLNAGGEANLSAVEIEELHDLVNSRLASAKTPRFVTRLYLSTTLGLWVWGNHWERDRHTVDLDPREFLVQKPSSPQEITFGRFLIESLPIVAEFIDRSFNNPKERSRYSGKVGQTRFMSDLQTSMGWIESLRLSPSTLLESWRAVRKLNENATLSSAVVVAFCSAEKAESGDIFKTATELLSAGLVPLQGQADVASIMLASGLLMDIARVGLNQAVQAALNSSSPPLSLASKIPAICISFKENNNASVERIFSLVTDREPDDIDTVKERLKGVKVKLGHQPGMASIVQEVLKLYPNRPTEITSLGYMEALGDALRFAEVIIRRGPRPQAINATIPETHWVSAPPSALECLKVAHEYTIHFGAAVYPSILGMVLTAAAGHDLRQTFPHFFNGPDRPEIKEIATQLNTWRLLLLSLNASSWPMETALRVKGPKYNVSGLGVNVALFGSMIGNQPPKFRFILNNTFVAHSLRSGGLKFSIPFFLPDPLPLPFRLDTSSSALERAWPDQSLNRYLVRHAYSMQFLSEPTRMRADLSEGQCYLPNLNLVKSVSEISVRKATGASMTEDQSSLALKLIAELNPAILDDMKILPAQAFATAKRTLVEQIRGTVNIMSNKAAINPKIRQGIEQLTAQMQNIENAKSTKQLVSVLAHTNFRLITDSSLKDLRAWLSSLVPENERQNISAQTVDSEGVRQGIVRLVAGVDTIFKFLLAELGSGDEKSFAAAEGLLDKVFLRGMLSKTFNQLAQIETKEHVALNLYSSTGYELSVAGLIGDTCAISELMPQSKNANIACIPFILPSQRINQPLFMGSALLFGVLLNSGIGSILIRPLNPSEYYLERYSAEDLVEGLFDDIKARVIASGEQGRHITSITIPLEERSGGILTNRPDVVAYLKRKYFSKPEQYTRTSLSNPRAAVYRDADIAGDLVVVRSW